MSCHNRRIFIASLVLTLTAGAAAQPVITGLNDTTFARSGRVAIEGSGFGAPGDVAIAGLTAWTTTWTDTRIVAYVPEAAPLGPVPLHVVDAGGEQSNEVVLTVTARQPDGRVRWTFEADGQNLWFRPALAPDGTIYLHGNNLTDGLIYALSPQGALLWVRTINWFPYGPPAAGPDGAVYAGSIATNYRISPQGQIDWEFTAPLVGDGVHIVPHPGPDGMLYGAYQAGIGAYSLDPATGELDWSNLGDPGMFDWLGNFGTEMVFGPSGPDQPIDRMYVTMSGTADFYAMMLDGEQIFARGVGTSVTEPAIGSDGTIYTPAILARYVMALDPADGSELWLFHPGGSAEITGIEIGPDDTLYYVASGKIQALDPHTQSLVWSDNLFMGFNRPTLSPDATTLVISGVPTNGQPGFIKGFAAANGEELWNVDLPGEPYPGFRVLGTHHARITPDSATAYVSTFTVADGSPFPDPHSFLYALDIGDGAGIPGDVDGDGAVGVLDLLALLSAWGPCPPPPAECPADLDGNGAVGVTDLLILLANWT